MEGNVNITAIVGLSERRLTERRLTRRRTANLTDVKRQSSPSSENKIYTGSSRLMFMKHMNNLCDRSNGKRNRH